MFAVIILNTQSARAKVKQDEIACQLILAGCAATSFSEHHADSPRKYNTRRTDDLELFFISARRFAWSRR